MRKVVAQEISGIEGLQKFYSNVCNASNLLISKSPSDPYIARPWR